MSELLTKSGYYWVRWAGGGEFEVVHFDAATGSVLQIGCDLDGSPCAFGDWHGPIEPPEGVNK